MNIQMILSVFFISALTSYADTNTYVKIDTNIVYMTEVTNEYLRVLVPENWRLKEEPVEVAHILTSFNILDDSTNSLFHIYITHTDKPIMCGCAEPHILRCLTDQDGCISYDFISDDGLRYVHKQHGKKYYADIHITPDAVKNHHVIADAMIDSLTIK